MSVSSIGIGSGVLTSELIESLVAAERGPAEARLNSQQEDLDAQLSAYGKIQSSLQDFRLPARVLSNPNALLGTEASSTSSAIDVTASSSAPLAEYSLEVSQVAQAHSVMSSVFASEDDVIGTGTLKFELGSYTQTNDAGTPADPSDDTFTFTNNGNGNVTVDISSGDNTLAGVAAAVNDANIGVRADVVNTGAGFVLVFTSEDSGADNALKITAQTDLADGVTNDNAGLSQLTYTEDPAQRFMTQTQDAQDALLKVNGIDVSSASNTIDDVISGVTLNINETTTSAKIKVTRDAEVVGDRIQDLVDAYNGFKEVMDEFSTFDPDNPESGLLLGDSTLRNLERQVDSVFGQIVSGMENAGIRSLAEMGLTLSRTDDVYEFDRDKFNKVFSENPEDVSAIFSRRLDSSSSRVEFSGITTGSTAAGSYNYEITKLATQGTYTGTSVNSLVIDASNDVFRVNVNGVASGDISLTQGAYASGDDLALEIQSQINSDSNLKNNAASVVVSFDSGSNQFTITSDKYNSSSAVFFTQVELNTENDLGFSINNGISVQGSNAEGTINGIGMKGTASSGEFSGLGVLTAFPVAVDATNDEFTMAVDGISSGAINLTQQSYASGADLATEIQTQINSDAILSAADKSVSVTFENDRLIITSDSTGTSSSIKFNSIDANSAADLGFSLNGSLSKNGEDFSDTGVTSTGNRLELDFPGNNADGIVLNVSVNDFQLGETSISGSANYVSGVADELVSLFNNFLSYDGLINSKTDSIKEQLLLVGESRTSLASRMNSFEERLSMQFMAADQRVAQLKNTEQFVTTQLAAIVNSFTKSDK